MDYTDPRLRFIINPGNLDNPTLQSKSENKRDEKVDAKMRELLEEWEPKLLKVVRDEFEVKRILAMLDYDRSAAIGFQFYSKGIFDIETIDNYIQDAYQNEGFLCKNGRRTRSFKETDFAKELSVSLNQLAFIGGTAEVMSNLETATTTET